MGMKLEFLKKKETLSNKNGIEVTEYDFSASNRKLIARHEACALICQVNRGKEIKSPKHLYQRLLRESDGLASEVLSFIPFALPIPKDKFIEINRPEVFNGFLRFCNVQELENNYLLLTNLRNVINFEKTYNESIFSENYLPESNEKPMEGYKVFHVKVPYFIVDHLRRHNLLNRTFAENWQSNRIVNNDDYFIIDELKDYYKSNKEEREWNSYTDMLSNISRLELKEIQKAYKIRKELINKGEFGLRMVNGFLGAWIFDNKSWHNFLQLRTGKGAQIEVTQLAEMIKELMQKQ